jgi:hypothetical protein
VVAVQRPPTLAILCRAGDLPAVLAMVARVVEAEELGTEAERERIHQELDALLWAVRERARRANEERRADALRLYANAVRRSGGSAAMN